MPTKKSAPAKKAAPAKAAKPAPKPTAKVVAKAPAKKAAPAKTAKPAPKPAVKVVAKAPAKKAAPAKAAKPAPKPAAKVVAKAPAKKAVPAKAAKPAPKPAAKVVAKAPVKKAAPAKKAAAPEKAVKPVAKLPVEKPAKAPKAPKPVVKKVIKAPIKKVAPKSDSSKASQISAKQTTPIPTKIPVALIQRPVKTEPVKEVKIPKINTKSSVPYNPGYVAMEKRVDVPTASSSPLVRYSDVELGEFKELIQKKLEAAKKELVFYQSQISRKDSSDNDDGRYMTMEDGSVSMEREQLSQMASRTVTYIDHLEKALMRIENKTYGICRETGKLIDKARLRAVPHATLSLEAKLGLVKKPTAE
jgi:RNA polymerase-binding transcription factor DksA